MCAIACVNFLVTMCSHTDKESNHIQQGENVLLFHNNEQLLTQLGPASSRKRQSVHFSPSGTTSVNRHWYNWEAVYILGSSWSKQQFRSWVWTFHCCWSIKGNNLRVNEPSVCLLTRCMYMHALSDPERNCKFLHYFTQSPILKHLIHILN
jgi:hypothetical protein